MSRPKRVKGIGWCGLYQDGNLGWLMPMFVAPGRGNAARPTPEQEKALKGHRDYHAGPNDMYRVEITVRALKDKRGKYIVKRGKAPR